MKLKLNTEDGKEKYLDVKFWSFFKGFFLSYLVMTGIFLITYLFVLAFLLQLIIN